MLEVSQQVMDSPGTVRYGRYGGTLAFCRGAAQCAAQWSVSDEKRGRDWLHFHFHFNLPMSIQDLQLLELEYAELIAGLPNDGS